LGLIQNKMALETKQLEEEGNLGKRENDEVDKGLV